tara:strand:- start:316 stop:813 length:498 start_codon:yes stop_codon:yes gene_type:complete
MTIHFHDSTSIASASGLGSNAGDILQTVGPNVLSSNFDTTSGTYQDSGIAQSITPSATSSKIIIISCIDIQGWGDQDRRPNVGIFYGSVSNSNKLCQQVAGEYHTGGSGSYSYGGMSFWFLHSPSTTSEITYRVGLASLDGSNVRIIGDTGADTRSFMYLQEVKG